MEIGVLPPYRSGIGGDPAAMRRFAGTAEAAGVDVLYLVEHVAVASDYEGVYPYSESGRMPLPDDCAIPDPLEVIGFLAGVTTRLRFGTGVLVAPHHHPLVLAKRLATLDVFSGGRVDVGFGVGWMREEIEATGGDFSSRGRRTTEMLAALRTALDDDPATFLGEFFSFESMRVHPRPTRRIRLDVGGHGEPAARRAGRVGDGFHPLGLDTETLAQRWALARRTAEEHHRDPDELSLSVTLPIGGLDEQKMEAMGELGVGRIVCSTAVADGAELSEQLEAVVRAARDV